VIRLQVGADCRSVLVPKCLVAEVAGSQIHTCRTCSCGEEDLHDGDTVVPGRVMHGRVTLVVDVVDARHTAVDMSLYDVQ